MDQRADMSERDVVKFENIKQGCENEFQTWQRKIKEIQDEVRNKPRRPRSDYCSVERFPGTGTKQNVIKAVIKACSDTFRCLGTVPGYKVSRWCSFPGTMINIIGSGTDK